MDIVSVPGSKSVSSSGKRLAISMNYNERLALLRRWREKKGKRSTKVWRYSVRIDDDPMSSWSRIHAVLAERYKDDPAFLQKIAAHAVGVVSNSTKSFLIFDNNEVFQFREVPLVSSAIPANIPPTYVCHRCKSHLFVQASTHEVRCLKCQIPVGNK